MIFRSLKAITCAAVFLSPLLAGAQAVKVDVGKIEYEDLKSPGFSDISGKKVDRKDWLEVEAEIEALAKPEPEDGFLESLSVRWYIAFKSPAGKGLSMITRDIEYVNIPVGEKVFVSAYMSPSMIKRISGGERAGKSIVEAVGLEISYGGRVVGEQSTKGDLKKWINAPSISKTDKYSLFSKNETPFNILWYDRYAEIAPEK